MRQTHLIGRIIVGGYFLLSAVNHFTHHGMMAGYAASKGVPAAGAAVIVSGLLLAFAGVTLMLGVLPRLSVAALVVFFVPVTLSMHAFWTVADPMARTAEMVNFTKNLALMGSALMFLAIPEPWPYSIASRLRARAPSPLPA